mmetsp:Transcript_5278/g.6271  ORF Transcript_5278/g.6271 Transcript_5278/m.6271 type:complete len:97 (+) Transcript_5278:938-1228(+)
MSVIRTQFTSNLDDRGLQFMFMWLDVTLHSEWVDTVNISTFPQVIVLNTGKTKKFAVHQSDVVTESSLASLLNSIIGGGVKFSKIKGNVLPLLKVK